MATAAQWLQGARPRTLPAAIAPVAAGTGAAALAGGFAAWKAALALLVALALQVGVNYANDYSDGVRGTDADRVGPLRLVGSGVARPVAVRNAALAAFAVPGSRGWSSPLTSAWWLLLVGVACVVGRMVLHRRPRGPMATAGSARCRSSSSSAWWRPWARRSCKPRVTTASVLAGVGCGALACAILVANNLRDLETDRVVGKRTLAVRLGDQRTRLVLCLAAGRCAGCAGRDRVHPRSCVRGAHDGRSCRAVFPRGAPGCAGPRSRARAQDDGKRPSSVRRPARRRAGPRHLELILVRPAGPRPTMGQSADDGTPAAALFMIAKDPVAARHEIFRDHEGSDRFSAQR